MGWEYNDKVGYKKGKKVAMILSCDMDNFVTGIKFDENENEIERKDIKIYNFDGEEEYYKNYNQFDDEFSEYNLFKECDVIENYELHKGQLIIGFNIQVRNYQFQSYNEQEISNVFYFIENLNKKYKESAINDWVKQSA